MSDGLRVGAHAFIIESNRAVREVMIKKVSGQLCLVAFGAGRGIQIGRNRLFLSKESAEAHLAQVRGRQDRAHYYERRFG
ncbi:MAG: hypothetical protein IJM53_09050 [Lachnospiraceae bacterium]|nr:hypothetical protein [Lachnospiraceae bacterium]